MSTTTSPFRRRAVRAVPRTLAMAALTAALVVSVTGSVSGPTPATAQSWSPGVCPDGSGVTVVVDFQSLGGSTIVRCAHGSQADGVAALRNAGVQVTGTNRWGTSFVCRLDGKPGPDREPCVDTPPASAHWSYWHAEAGGDWTSSNFGATNRTPPQGTFEGWSFFTGDTDGDVPSGSLPPRVAPVRPDPPPSSGDGGSGDDGGSGSGNGSGNGSSSGSGSTSDGSSGTGGSSGGSGSNDGSSGGDRPDRDASTSRSSTDGTRDDAHRDTRNGGGSAADGDDDSADDTDDDQTTSGRREAATQDDDPADTDDPDEDGTEGRTDDDQAATELRSVPGDDVAASDVEVGRSGGRGVTGTLLGTALVGSLAIGAGILAWRRRRSMDDLG